MAGELVTDDLRLVRASLDQRAAVERLQQAAYARNRELLGLEPVPLLANYGEIFGKCEVWIKPIDGANAEIEAALILDTDRADDIVIWSVATDPASQHNGIGHQLLDCAEHRARALGRNVIRLYTGATLTHLIDWYTRNGYKVERREQLEDRVLVHMIKRVAHSV